MDDIQSWWEVPSIAHFCSLFRVAFNLLDFDIEELEEALLTDGTEDSGSSLLQELIVRLLCGCLGNNGISTFNYQMFLRRLFRQKCREYGMENPFNSDIDFQFLPLRTKVEILHALCDFRLDADDVIDVLKNLDSDSLRVHPLGYDENRSAYWYFYGTRLYREDYPKAKRKKRKGREKEKQRNRKRRNKKEEEESSSSSSDFDESKEIEMGVGEWQVVCYTESDWERLALKMEDSLSKEERALHTVLAEDFLPEIPRLFEEKERLQRKRLMEMQPRRQSSRIEKLKHQKEEERLRLRVERQKLEDDKDVENKERAKKDRAVRAMMRSRSSSECGSSIGGSSSNVESTDKPKGRQTNNSLSSATGQIIIQPSRQKLRTSQVFRQSVEDLQTGLYKILDRIKNHDDAWPFVDPVEEEYAPRYYSVISHPMDLQRMEDKLDNGEYLTFNDFKADFQLIVDNCRQYNGSDNEYTEMVGKLQEAFEAAVDRYLETEMSTDEEVAVEFPGEQTGGRKKRGSLNTKTNSEPRTPSESLAQSRSPESENEIDMDADNERNTLREESSDAEMSQDSDIIVRKNNSKKNSVGRLNKKSGVAKDPDALEALELATEQTLKDINKWLDDTPRFSEFSSASNSPSQIVISDDIEISNRIETEYRQRLKLERPQRPRERGDPHRRRLMKDQTFLKRRREIHRTIDRLQPGKSKGNLLNNLSSTKNGEETCASSKDTKSNVADKVDGSAPKLSLGTVLTHDVIGFGKHNFDENDASSPTKKDVESVDCCDNKQLIDDEDVKKSPKEEIRLEDSCDTPPEKRTKVEQEPLVVIDVEKKNTPAETGNSKPEKSTPNFTAWFKAFGAPKSQPAAKKKTELSAPEEPKDSPKNVESVKILKEDDTEEDKERKLSVVPPPLQSPAKRQRKASTGSSVSERSSFSQDPMDPLIDGSSPRPSLDEPYLSPQSEPMKTPYHHSPINGTIRVGFYQDTSFPRSNSSSSPRDPPSCSPREPQGCSPRDLPNCSPRDLPNCSPREPFTSPKSDYHPTYPPVTIPNYSAPAVTSSPASSLYEAPVSPYPAHMPYYDTSKSLTDQYRPSVQTAPAPAHSQVEKPLTSVFPVKKRIYNEVDSQPVKVTQDLSSTYRGGSFTPTKGAVEQDRGFTPTPGRMPTQSSPAVRHGFSPDTGLPIGLTHHTLPPHPLVDPYADERLLASPYFSGESIYAKSAAAQVSSSSLPLTMFSQSGTVTTTSNYTKDNPSHSPYPARPELSEVNVSSDYTRSSLTYPEPRSVKSSENVPSYSSSVPLSKSKSPSALNYSSRSTEILSPNNSNGPSPINFSNSDMHSNKVVTSSPIAYFSRAQDIMPPTKPSLEYAKLNTDLLTGKVSAPSPLSYASNRAMVDMMPGKVNSPYRPDLSSTAGLNYSTSQDLVSNKISVPSPLSYSSQSDILSGKVNYNHPISDLMQSHPRYNYSMSDIIQTKGYAMPDLMQTKNNPSGYVGRPVELLSPNVYNYPPVSRSTPTSKPSEPPLKASTKKQSKKSKKSSNVDTSSFQQYSSPEAIALKTASVVPGSAFNFGPAPLKDSYTSLHSPYLDEMRSSSYYVPHSEPPNSSSKSSSSPHSSGSPFPFLGASSRPPAYPHPFMNTPYQQYLPRHPDELLRPMVLHHQGLLPAAGYPPGYLMHEAITRPPWPL